MIVDGWGHNIGYEVDSKGAIVLTSYGRDGRPGGAGVDADIIRTFSFQTN